MIRHFRLWPICLLVSLAGFGQAQLGRVEYQKKDRQAIVLYTQYEADIVEGAVKARMEALGNRGKENKSLINLGRGGFLAFKGAVVPELGSEAHDLYFKAERRSRQERDQSVLYLVIGKGADDFATSSTDPALMEKAKEFLNQLLPHIQAYNLEVEISNQEALIKKIDDKINGLVQDSVDLDKKLKALEEKLQQNSVNRQQQLAEREKQRLVLEAMKAKRKS